MIILTKQQNSQLKGLAHQLKPVVMIGQNGLTEAVIKEAKQALEQHELIKIKIVADKEERLKIRTQIAKKTQSTLVQKIGQMAVYFKQNPKKPIISLV